MVSTEEIVNYIKSQKEISVPALQKQFSVDYFTVSMLVQKLKEEGILRPNAGVSYTVTAVEEKSQPVRRNRLFDDDDDDDDEDDGDSLAELTRSLEERRRRLLEALEKNGKDDGDDNGDAEGEEDGGAEDGDAEETEDEDDGDGTAAERAFADFFSETAAVELCEGDYFVSPAEGFTVGETAVRFKLYEYGGVVYLSDDGFVAAEIGKHLLVCSEEFEKEVHAITARYGVEEVEDTLHVRMDFPTQGTACMLRLFTAMERILALDEEKLSVCSEYEKETDRMMDVVGEWLEEDPAYDRGRLLAHAAKLCREADQEGDIDRVLLLARVRKGLTDMSDSDFDEIREAILCGQTEGEDNAAQEENPAEESPAAPEKEYGAPGTLVFPLGKDLDGKPVSGDLVRFKHILIGGAERTGKSVFLHSLIANLINAYSPEALRFILCDSGEQRTFHRYEGMPHLMTGTVVSDAEEFFGMLRWVNGEMEHRYMKFNRMAERGAAVRNIDEYNSAVEVKDKQLARIVIIVDEFADYIKAAKDEFEERLMRLTQKGRAAGIHLILATREVTPSVITGMVKANFSTRFAFSVPGKEESRILIDDDGAEQIHDYGDFLVMTTDHFKCRHVHGALLSLPERFGAIRAARRSYKACFLPREIFSLGGAEGESGKGESEAEGEAQDEEPVDPFYLRALAIVVRERKVSISFLQRKCAIGYGHAGKILEWMEYMGYVSPFDVKTKRRKVLLTKKEFEKKYGPLDG